MALILYPLAIAACYFLVIFVLALIQKIQTGEKTSLLEMVFTTGTFLLILLPALLAELVNLLIAAICGALSMAKKEPLWPLGALAIILCLLVYLLLIISSPLFK